MALDPRYIVSADLEELLVNKDTGLPLAFGRIEFWQDDNRAVPKLVYTLTGAPPNYTYTALPNWITLNAIGAPSDNAGNNVPIYYFPYDINDNLQLYYIVVRDQNGVIQFTREAWPNASINNYYQSLLKYKPIPSYLIGWDFAYNPAQFLGDSVQPFAIGANKAQYVWDQTIIHQTTNSSISVAREGSGALRINAVLDTQFALIQYLDAPTARKILNDRIACHIAATTNMANLGAVVSLYYTLDATLPNLNAGSNLSLIQTLTPQGPPLNFNGNWIEVPRGDLGPAKVSVGVSGDTEYLNYDLSGWDMKGIAACNTATFFAIVISTRPLSAGTYLELASVSLCAGDIATRPSPKTRSETLRLCQAFYEKSFNQGLTPAQNVGANTGEWVTGQAVATGATQIIGTIPYKVGKNSHPTVTLFNPSGANSQARNITAGADMSNTAVVGNSLNGFYVSSTAVGAAGNALGLHWTADSRLGL